MGHGIYRLAADAYIEWSTVVDAPISHVLRRDQALVRFGPSRVDRADRNGHSWTDTDPDTDPEEAVGWNRAGPNEESLTVAAILKRYAHDAPAGLPLLPEDIKPSWSNDFGPDGESEDEHGPIYVWKPWRPGEAPAVIPEGMNVSWTCDGVRIPPDELERLIAEAKAERAAKVGF